MTLSSAVDWGASADPHWASATRLEAESRPSLPSARVMTVRESSNKLILLSRAVAINSVAAAATEPPHRPTSTPVAMSTSDRDAGPRDAIVSGFLSAMNVPRRVARGIAERKILGFESPTLPHRIAGKAATWLRLEGHRATTRRPNS